VLVEVDEDHDGDHDADAAEHDPGPGGPAAPQGTIGGVDVGEAFRPTQMAGIPVRTRRRRLNRPRVSAFRARVSMESEATWASGSDSTPACGPAE
jgi:hypothetical protein